MDDFIRAHAAFIHQLFDTSIITASSTSGTTTYTATGSPAPTAYTAGQLFAPLITNANTGPVTFNFNGLGAKAVKKTLGTSNVALVPGDLAAGSTPLMRYDGTDLILLNPPLYNAVYGPLAGRRNYLINGAMRFNQRGTSSVADDTYCFDRWYILAQTAAITVSALANVQDGLPNAIRMTQGNASAQRFGLAQIIESKNCIDLRGATVNLSAKVRCSNSTDIRAAIIEWTGTADSVTSDWVSDWTSSAYTAGNFFTSTSTTVTGVGETSVTATTVTDITLSGTVGSSANNIAVLIWTESTQAQNSTLDISNVQLERGASATSFERVPYQQDLYECMRYFQSGGSYFEGPVSSGSDYASFTTISPMRTTAPTLTFTLGTDTNFQTSTVASGVSGGVVVWRRRRADGTGAGFFEDTFTAESEL